MGDLTLRGVTREVCLDAHYRLARSGTGQRLVLTLMTSLNRRDFGLVWNTPIISVTDMLDVTLAVEATHV